MTANPILNKRPLVVLFGAGASYGARDGARPPLGKDLICHLLYVYNGLIADRCGAFDSFFENDREIAKDVIRTLRESVSRGQDFESFLSEYQLKVGIKNFQEDPKIKVLTKLLSASMVSFWLWGRLKPDITEFPFFEKKDLYDSLIHAVKLGKLSFPLQKIVFITPNYDILFEQALKRANLLQAPESILSYPGTSENDVLLLKIHGSANWVGNMGDGGLLDQNKPTPIGLRITPSSREYMNIFPDWKLDFGSLVQLGNEIIMAHYTIDKPAHVNLSLIKQIRDRAIQHVKLCERAILLGVHLEKRKDADPCLFEILTILRDRGVPVTYVGIAGPDANEAKDYYKFDVLTGGFTGFLKKTYDENLGN